MHTSIGVRCVSQHPIQLDSKLKNQGKSLIWDLQSQIYFACGALKRDFSAVVSTPGPLTKTPLLTSEQT